MRPSEAPFKLEQPWNLPVRPLPSGPPVLAPFGPVRGRHCVAGCAGSVEPDGRRGSLERPTWIAPAAALALLGCGGADDEAVVSVGDRFGAATVVRVAPACAEPHAPFERLVEEGAARGLSGPPVEGTPPSVIPVIVVFDLDGDLDPDVVGLHGPSGAARLRMWRNDGSGTFAVEDPEAWSTLATDPPHASGVAAADLDGDRLPELLLLMPGELRVSQNLGAGRFGPFQTRYQHGVEPPPTWSSFALGDVDADADLDVLITSTFAEFTTGGPAHGEEGELPPPGPELLLTNDSGEFTLDRALQPAAGPIYAQIGAVTDLDSDGDLDLFVPSEFGGLDGAGPTAFYRNEGSGSSGLILTESAAELRIDWDLGGMGLDSWDSNGDGLRDYCIAQVGPIVCALSTEEGPFVHSGGALGLEQAPTANWSGYSLDVVDLDDDGRVDAVAAGGDNQPGGPINVDRIWQGEEGGTFLHRTNDSAFSSTEEHFGLVAADVDGDGTLDVVVGGLQTPNRLWMNRCGPGRSVEIELDGPGLNRHGFGAEVRVEVAGVEQVREFFHLRAAAQGPARQHFGVGQADIVDHITVRWPGGARTEIDGPIPAGVVLRIEGP